MQAWIDRLDDYDEGRLTGVFASRQEFLLGGLAPGDTVLELRRDAIRKRTYQESKVAGAAGHVQPNRLCWTDT
jgi:hypothetical protein